MKTLLLGSVAAVAVLLIGFAASAAPASAHGGASVAVMPTAAAAGDQVQVKIEGYEDTTLVTITLEGMSGTVALGTVTTDTGGAATTTVMIPDGTKPGSYSVKAVGGDDNATADLAIKSSAVTNTSATIGSAASAGSAGSSTMSGNAASSAEGGGLTYKQPTAQWVGIAIAALAAALAGFALVLRREPRR